MDRVSHDDQDAQHTADALLVEHATLVAAEARTALRIAHWADLHDPDSIHHPVDVAGRVLPGTERGALILDTAAADHPDRDPAHATGAPRLWHLRQIVHATHTAGLTLAQARWVDAQTSPCLPTLPRARVEELLQAKIIEADPSAAHARDQAAATRRFVTTGQTNEHGLKTLIAQAGAGDVIVLVDMLDRIAQCLALDGDTSTLEVRRSTALGIIANPPPPATTAATAARRTTTRPSRHTRTRRPTTRPPSRHKGTPTPTSRLGRTSTRPVRPTPDPPRRAHPDDLHRSRRREPRRLLRHPGHPPPAARPPAARILRPPHHR